MASHHSSALEVFKKLVIFFFAGVAVFIGLVLFVYALTLILDKCCVCCPSSLHASMSGTTDVEDTDQGPVARKAGLWGLTIDERKLILRRLFQPILYREDMRRSETRARSNVSNDPLGDLEIITFTSDEDDDDFVDTDNSNDQILENDSSQQQQILSDAKSQQQLEPMPQPNGESAVENDESNSMNHKVDQASHCADQEQQEKTVKEIQSLSTTSQPSIIPTRRSSPQDVDISFDGDDDEEAQLPDNVTAAATVATTSTNLNKHSAAAVVANQVVDNADLDHTCPICLREYMYGDTVVSGTGCTHLFHYECVMPWLETHDHCPYCRNEMMTAFQMRHAAIQILGAERVAEMGPRPFISATSSNAITTNEHSNNAQLPNYIANAIRSASGRRWLRRDEDDGY